MRFSLLTALVLRPAAQGRRIACVAILLTAWTAPSHASEQASEEPAHCRALRAEARSTASLLFSPSVNAQALRAPNMGDLNGQGLFQPGPQARASVAFSAVDALRGRSVLAQADADCERWTARAELEEVLQQGASYGRAEALRVQIAALEGALPQADAMVADAEKRLARELITVLEVDDLRLRRLALDARLGELREELSLLDAQGPAKSAATLAPVLRRYETAAMAGEAERSHQRTLSAWQVDAQLGAIPYPQRDWFGMVTVGYRPGALRQGAAEEGALAAARDDLASGQGELRMRAGHFAAAMRVSAARLREELALIDRQLALHHRRLDEERPESEKLRQALAPLEMDRLELQARRAFVERLAALREDAGRALP